MKFVCMMLLLVMAISSDIQIEISQSMVKYDWNNTEQQLNNIKSLTLITADLSENSLHKIFRLQMPRLRHLSFDMYAFSQDDLNYHIMSENIVLTPLIIHDILTSKYFSNLINLTLTSCSIDDRAFAFLDKNTSIQTSLQRFTLKKNRIGKRGFNSLSKIHFREGLIELNLGGNLLAESESIEAIIKMICGPNPQKCIDKLEALDISDTAITREGFIRLFSQINTKNIKQLNFYGLKLLNQATWQEGLNFSAFQFLVSLPFPKLAILSFHEAHITDAVLELFANWSLPSLKELNLAQTMVSDYGIINFIKKKNMPVLSELRLDSTLLTDYGFYHIVEQNFSLTFLSIGMTKITNAGFLFYNKMNLDIMTKLQIQGLNLESSTLKQFFKKAELTNLKLLNIAQNSQISDLFSYFPFEYLGSLQILRISEIDVSDSLLKMISKKKVLLPKLKYLYLENINKNMLMANYLANQAPILFPKLEKLVLSDYGNIFINFNAVKENLSKAKDGLQIYLDWITLRKMKNKYQILTLTSFGYLFYRQNQESISEEAIFKDIPNLFDFKELKMLQINNQYEMSGITNMLQISNTKTLPSLLMLMIPYEINLQDFVEFMSVFTFPVLQTLMYNIKVSSDITNDYLLKKVVPLFQRQKNLMTLKGHMDFMNEEEGRDQQKFFFDQLYFPFLKNAYIEDGSFELYQIENIIRNHNQTLRRVNVGGNFLEKGFMNLLYQTGCVLDQLGLRDTSFTVAQFALFGKVRTQFLTVIDLSRDDLTNDHILAMIKTKDKEPLFPKMKNVVLEENDIRQQGLQALLKTGMYNLFILPIDQNTNPNFINQLLTYPTGVQQIIADDIEVYSIKDDLNPSSTENIKSITIKTSSFSSEDFHSLGRLSFQKLQISRLLLENVYDCSVLNQIIKINKNAHDIVLVLKNDQQGLNSSCLAELLENDTYVSSINSLMIQDHYASSYMPEFIQIMLNSNRNLENLILSNTRLPPDTLTRIFDNNFHALSVLILRRSYLNDDALSALVKNSMNHLRVLDISYTQITDEGIYALSQGFMQILMALDISGNNIGALALESLGLMNLLELHFLFLNNCKLKGDALITINTYNFPKLMSLDLSYNNFEENDLIDFVANLDRTLLPQLSALNLQGVEISKSGYDTVVEILESKGFKEKFLTPPYNMKQTNAAHY